MYILVLPLPSFGALATPFASRESQLSRAKDNNTLEDSYGN